MSIFTQTIILNLKNLFNSINYKCREFAINYLTTSFIYHYFKINQLYTVYKQIFKLNLVL